MSAWVPEGESFVRAIRASPQDDLLRLVYADWLDENGDPDRAEFIRLQIHRNATTADAQMYPQEERLLALHRDEWMGQDLGFVQGSKIEFGASGFRRGFLAHLDITQYELERTRDAWAAGSTIDSIAVEGECNVARLGHHPCASRLRSLYLDHCHIGDRGASWMAQAGSFPTCNPSAYHTTTSAGSASPIFSTHRAGGRRSAR